MINIDPYGPKVESVIPAHLLNSQIEILDDLKIM